MKHNIRAFVAALVACSALALSGCQSDPAVSDSDRKPQLNDPSATETGLDSDSPERAVLLRFDGVTPGAPVNKIENTGALPVYTRVVSWNDGKLTGVESPFGQGVRTPEFTTTRPEFAIIAVFNQGVKDLLSPGEENFSFGADFAIDQITTGDIIDNGDNLVARGLFESAAQYKLQVDNGQLSCRVAGLRGEVFMKSPVKLKAQQWYRTRCTRIDDTVTLEIAPLGDREVGEWTKTTKTGPIGEVLMAGPVPLAVGGKLSPDGRMFPTTTDQFNGKLDRVVYRLLE